MVDIVELGDNEVKFQKAYKDFMVAKPEDAKARFQEMRDAFAKLPKKEGGGIEDSVKFELPRMKPIAKGFKDVLASSDELDQDKATKLQNTAFLADLLLDLQEDKEGKKEIGKERYDKLASLIDGKNFDEKAIQETLGLEKPISIKKEKDGTIIIEVDATDIGKFQGKKIDKDGKATSTQEKVEAEKDAAAKDAVKNDEAGTDDKKEEKSKFRDPRKVLPSYEKLAGFVMAMMIACTVFPPLLPFVAPAIGIALAIGAVKTVVEVVGAVVDAVVAVVTGVKTVGKAVIDFGKEVKDLGGKFFGLFGAAFKAAYKGVTGKSWDEQSPGPEDKIAEDMKKAKEEGKGVVGTVQKGLETAGKEADESIKKANMLQRENLEKDLKGRGASESQIKGVLDALEKSQKDPSLENKLALAKAQSSLEKDLKEKAKDAVMKDLDKKGATPEQKDAVAKAMEKPKDQEAALGANKVMGELANKKPNDLTDKEKAGKEALEASLKDAKPKTIDLKPEAAKPKEPEKTGLLDKITAKFTSFTDGVKGLFSSSKTPDTKSVEMKDMSSGAKPLKPEPAAKPKEPEASISSPVGTGSKSEPAKPKEPEAVAKPSLTRRNSEPALGSDFTEAVKNLTGKVTEPPTHSGSTSEKSPSQGKANDHNITTGAGRGGVGG